MRKHISKQDKPERASISLKRILVISLIFFVLTGMMGVMASNEKLMRVKITLSSGYEMYVMTTSNKVSDILNDNNIIIMEGETVEPAVDSEITDEKTIVINKVGSEEQVKQYFSEEEILQSYSSIVEKIVVINEEIPYETIVKDISAGSEATQNRVVQAGVNGIKEVTYKVKYQNGNEIEKTVVSENIIKEKVDKIVEVRTGTVTSRYGSRATSGSKAEYQSYAEKRCFDYGWTSSDFDCLVSLWNRESNWNIYASNKSSGAYGIPQSLPAKKMASAGADYLTNYKTQIEWGLNYIKGRYGNPTNAWIHSERYNWY